MQRKKTQVALEQDGRLLLMEAAHARSRERSRCQGFVANLTSIVSAAHKLPDEIDPPARAWASLRTQLEKEGILRRLSSC